MTGRYKYIVLTISIGQTNSPSTFITFYTSKDLNHVYLHITSYAIAGVGQIGMPIAEELLKKKAEGKVENVVLLTRSSSPALEALVAQGARVATVDYTSQASLEAALAGVEVVISAITLSAVAQGIQETLASAAKTAGVRVFAPSEFGMPSDEHGPLAMKHKTYAHLKKIDLPWLIVHTGLITELVFQPFAQLDLRSGKILVGGSGDELLSVTAKADIGRFLVHVLTKIPSLKLEWRTLRIEGERTSLNRILGQYTAKTGQKVDVTYRSIEELEAAIKAQPHDIPGLLRLILAKGGGVVGKPEEVDNKEFPDWNPKTVVEILAP